MFTVLREIVKRGTSRLGFRSAWSDYVTAAVVLLLMIALQLVQGDSDRAHLGLDGLYHVRRPTHLSSSSFSDTASSRPS